MQVCGRVATLRIYATNGARLDDQYSQENGDRNGDGRNTCGRQRHHPSLGSWLTTTVPDMATASRSMMVRKAATLTPRPMISADLTRHATPRCAGRTAADRKGCAHP